MDCYIEYQYWGKGRGPRKPTLLVTAEALGNILAAHLKTPDGVPGILETIAYAASENEGTEAEALDGFMGDEWFYIDAEEDSDG
jgi:hypothetical protein